MNRAEKSKRTVTFCLILLVLSFIKFLFWRFGDLDEFWNYNLARSITMGLVPYRDFNLVLTPLYSFINAAVLFVVRTLIAYRISCSLICFVLLFLIYKSVCDRTNGHYALPAALIGLVMMGTVTYNTLFMVFAFGILALLGRGSTDKRDLIIGVLTACAALSRQTSGGILIFIVLFILIREERRVRPVLMYVAGGAIPCIMLLVYLLVTGSFGAFWDYCLFGLFSFGSGNFLIRAAAVPYLLTALAGIACDIVRLKTDREDALRHLLIGIPVLLMCVPIVDEHASFAAIWFLIPAVCVIRDKAGKSLTVRISHIAAACCSIAVLTVTFVGVMGNAFCTGYTELKGVPADTALLDDYSVLLAQNRVFEEKGGKVTVLSSSAVILSVMSEKTSPVFDMFNNGNFGTRDPLVYVQEVIDDPDAIILMPDDYDTEGWQNPDGIYEYVTSHCEPVASYGRFVWYKPSLLQ